LEQSIGVANYFGNTEVYGKMILICNFKKLDAMVLNGFRIQSIGRVLTCGKELSVCEYVKVSLVCKYGNESAVCE
jgi:hypothetical protein